MNEPNTVTHGTRGDKLKLPGGILQTRVRIGPHGRANRDKEAAMPVRKVKGGYRYGSSGKVYSSKSKAAKQGRAIRASQARRR